MAPLPASWHAKRLIADDGQASIKKARLKKSPAQASPGYFGEEDQN